MTAEASAPPPRPRRRRLLVAAAILVGVLVVGYAVWWLRNAEALSYTGTGGLVPDGMTILKPMDASEYDFGQGAPPSYGWHRGGQVFASFMFHNSLSVPITITGVVQPPPDEIDLLSGAQLRRPRPGVSLASKPSQTQLAGPVHVGAGQDVELDLLWRASNAACADIPAGSAGTSWISQQSVDLHFYQIIPFITQTQDVSIANPSNPPDDGSPGEAFNVAAPTRKLCPAGYPPVNVDQRIS